LLGQARLSQQPPQHHLGAEHQSQAASNSSAMWKRPQRSQGTPSPWWKQWRMASSTRRDITPAQLVDNLLCAFEGGVILSRLDARPALLAEQIHQHRHYVDLLFPTPGDATAG
jgi:hypothetical protein